jgi:hypothetical protein
MRCPAAALTKVLRVARRLASLSATEIADLLRAQVAITAATWRLRRLKVGQLVNKSQLLDTGKTLATVSGARDVPVPARALELALALERAAEHGLLRPECLVRSLALRNLLDRSGIDGSMIRVGVRKDGETLQAHAWVELNGAVLGDRESHIARFVPVEGLNVGRLS